MQVTTTYATPNYLSAIFNMLLKHFQYSIKDISSYEELTEEEKKICSEELFNELTFKN